MKQSTFKVIGVMSGTSLDGIDLAEIIFTKTENWQFEIGITQTIAYSDKWFKTLKHCSNLEKEEVGRIDERYSFHLGNIIHQFIKSNAITNLNLIASHGHTIWHQPKRGFTLQIGNRPEIKKGLGMDIPIICDFRIQDVKLGGQGAPLVPIGDRLLFGNYDYCMNLGGFSNISYEENEKRIAFDICPVNTVLNHYAEKLHMPYDNGGKIAQKGHINTELLSALNKIPFYRLSNPKSLGIEFVQTVIFPLIDRHTSNIPDILATFCEHIAQQIAYIITHRNSSLLITGGGVYNSFLINRIKSKLPQTSIIIPDSKIIQYKEALIFGFLGILKQQHQINILSSVTGASKDHSSGVVY